MQGFVVHTNKYAGNFERELCAWMTGHVGECGVGEKYVNEYGDVPILGVVQKLDSDDRIYRPCAIHSNPNYFNNGRGEHIEIGTDEAKVFEGGRYPAYKSVIVYFGDGFLDNSLVQILKNRAIAYCTFKKIKIENFEIVEVQ